MLFVMKWLHKFTHNNSNILHFLLDHLQFYWKIHRHKTDPPFYVYGKFQEFNVRHPFSLHFTLYQTGITWSNDSFMCMNIVFSHLACQFNSHDFSEYHFFLVYGFWVQIKAAGKSKVEGSQEPQLYILVISIMFKFTP